MRTKHLFFFILFFAINSGNFFVKAQSEIYSYSIKIESVTNAAEYKDFEVAVELRKCFGITPLPKFNTETHLFTFNSEVKLTEDEFKKIISKKGYELVYWKVQNSNEHQSSK